jgi:hypothetical protein
LGEAVLDQLARVPRDDQDRPQRPLTVTGAEAYAESLSIADLHLTPAQRVRRASAASVLGAAVHRDRGARMSQARDRPVFFGLLIIVLVGFTKVLLRRRLSRRHVVSLDLVTIAIGFFLLLMMRLPMGPHSGWVGALLFIGLAVVYRLLGHFEEPAEK